MSQCVERDRYTPSVASTMRAVLRVLCNSGELAGACLYAGDRDYTEYIIARSDELLTRKTCIAYASHFRRMVRDYFRDRVNTHYGPVPLRLGSLEPGSIVLASNRPRSRFRLTVEPGTVVIITLDPSLTKEHHELLALKVDSFLKANAR